jgi:hypothetical protein
MTSHGKIVALATSGIAAIALVVALVVWMVKLPSGRVAALQGQSNVTLTFYGKAVDQDGRGLPGVSFSFSLEAFPKNWSFANHGVPFVVTKLDATSDANGLFQFEVTGHMLRQQQATIAGYRQLQELDAGTYSADEGITVFTDSIPLNSWGQQLYKTAPEKPAIFVFVKEGVTSVSALPGCGGYSYYGYRQEWRENKPGWPKQPSLADVNWVNGQPRSNVKIPLIFRAVDTEGKPLSDVVIWFEVERYLTLVEMESYAYDKQRRTANVRVQARTAPDGLAHVDVEGFRLARIYDVTVDGHRFDEGPFFLDQVGPDYYSREFMDNKGQIIFRCDHRNPILLVLAAKGAAESHVLPCRGGFDLKEGTWQMAAPMWPNRVRYHIQYRDPTTSQPSSR